MADSSGASTTDRIAESIVSGIARAARTLGVVTIAEHVETAAVADRLRELDVTLGQGFHLGRPQPLAQVVQHAVQQALAALPRRPGRESRIAVLALASQSRGSSAPIIRADSVKSGAAMLKAYFLSHGARAPRPRSRRPKQPTSPTACGSGCMRRPIRATAPFENLISGAAVEVLERNTNYARVRLADGREGWVKAMYLVDSEAGRRARGRARGRDRDAQGGCDRSQDGADGGRARARRGSRRSYRRRRDRPRPSRTPCSACRRRIEAHEERLESYRHTLPLKWVIPAVVVALVGRFSRRLVVARRPDTPSSRRFSRVLVGA